MTLIEAQTCIRAIRRIGLLALAMSAAGCANRTPETPATASDLRFSAHAVIEAAPVQYAITHLGAARAEITNGGIPSLFRGEADLAGHADTQLLRNSLANPDVRIILTVAEGHYQIVARRSAGIRSVADLRGKKVAAVKDSSSAYYLHRALETAGMTESDVETVAVPLPPKDAYRMLLDGRADALALWDPEPLIAVERLGSDAIILDPDTGYREIYNLHSTAAKLADPVTRAKIVRFVATLIEASAKITRDPAAAIALTAPATGYSADLIRKSWPHHVFPATLAPDLLDTLVKEEAWMAAHQNRPARTREQLAPLIDSTIEAEARALLGKRR